MRFLVDAQLPPALARWLLTQGHAAEHVAERGLAASSDADIWAVAMELGAAIVTKDRDFADNRRRADHGPPIIWLRMANTRRNELLARFERLLPMIEAALERGETLIEVM